jgi:hypothetical protein
MVFQGRTSYIPLSSVINDISAKTGIKFLFLNSADSVGYNRPFTIKFEPIPIRAALEKLLLEFSCSFISDRDDNIQQVFILGAKTGLKSVSKTQPYSINFVKSGAVSKEELMKTSPKEEVMNIGQSEGMNVGPPNVEGMNIAPPSAEGMKIGPPSKEGMNIGPPSAGGMDIGPPSGKGMEIGPPSAEGMNIAPPNRGGANTIRPIKSQN